MQRTTLTQIVTACLLTVGIASLSSCANSARRLAPPAMVEGHFAADDSVQLFYRVVGDGPRTVVIPADLYLYPAFERLAPGRTLVFYDMRNRGRSDSVSADRANSIVQDVADLDALRRHIGADSIDVIGYSYLGLMVALYALEHPANVRRIVQIGPVPLRFDTRYPPEVDAADYFAAMDSTGIEEIRAMRRAGIHVTDPKAYCEREWEVTRPTLVGDPANARWLASPCDLPNEWPVNLAKHMARHFESVQHLHVPSEDIARITAPVLTIHGTIDRNAPYGAGREWAMMLPNARLLTVAGAAHAVWADAPDRVLGAIDAFLRGSWPQDAEKVTTLVP